MTESEAKAILERDLNCLKQNKALPDSIEAMQIAINALEKQIPKKTIINIGDTDKDRLACCPVCDSNVDWTYNGFWRKGNPKYCRSCGQAIDWSVN